MIQAALDRFPQVSLASALGQPSRILIVVRVLAHEQRRCSEKHSNRPRLEIALYVHKIMDDDSSIVDDRLQNCGMTEVKCTYR
jgi:hypothetical protein